MKRRKKGIEMDDISSIIDNLENNLDMIESNQRIIKHSIYTAYIACCLALASFTFLCSLLLFEFMR